MVNKIKILMLGKPGGTLARTYEWHIEALNSDKKCRYEVDDILEVGSSIDIRKYDIFWFYAKAFHPNLYDQIKRNRPNAKIICGPNILLDKPDVGLSDDWDKWYAADCRPDIHLDQVSFYSKHVQKFLSYETSQVAKCLDKCMKIDDSFYDKDSKKEYDCLIYSKKRRYDYKFEEFRNKLINLLEEADISFYEIKAGKFGSYKREDYFNALNKSKVTVSLSLDECPGILNYESMFFDVPVIGSIHNVPVNSSFDLYVDDTDFMTQNYLVRKDDAAEKYFLKIKEILNSKKDYRCRKFIIDHTSFSRYCDTVSELLQ
tara:strand:+ start:316 stop:1263 length:948 start_codon:yes stop_codon:yes gene_type:complete